MPKSLQANTAPLRGALFECFRAATRLVRPDRRRQLIMVGGAASIAHSSVFYTEDVDVAAPPAVLIDIWEAVSAGAPNFSFESDGKIAFDAPQGFRVGLDLLEIGAGFIERIHVAEPFYEGSVASMSDLLRLRAVTVVDSGSDGEKDDFRWLLAEVTKAGQFLPGLDKEELEVVEKAVVSCLGVLVAWYCLLSWFRGGEKKKKKKKKKPPDKQGCVCLGWAHKGKRPIGSGQTTRPQCWRTSSTLSKSPRCSYIPWSPSARICEGIFYHEGNPETGRSRLLKVQSEPECIVIDIAFESEPASKARRHGCQGMTITDDASRV